MLWKGRRQSSNVEDIRTQGGRRSIGFKGGIIGTLILAALIYFLGGDPLQVLNTQNDTPSTNASEAPLSAHDKEMGEFVAVVLADTEDVWNKLFENMGKTYQEPKLVLFRGSVSSACGYAEDATGPFYCSRDEKIYIDLNYLELLQNKLGANGDFAAAYIIAHEVGHHVQNLLGTIDEVNKFKSSGVSDAELNKITIKMELQADFLAGVWVHHAQKMKNFLEEGDLDEALNAASAVGDDQIQMKTRGYITPDSFQHGTSAQRKNWLSKGIKTGNLSQGNTFSTSEL